MAVVTVIAIAGFSAIYAASVGLPFWAAIDSNAIVGVDPARAPLVHRATESLLETISVLSIALFGTVIAALAVARRRADLALGCLVLIAAANLSAQVLKPALARLDLTGADGLRALPAAYPSGHATVAASLALALVLAAPARLRIVAVVGGSAYAAAVGVALVLAGWHYPSDVAGAYLLVMAWACLIAPLMGARARGQNRRHGGTVVPPVIAVLVLGALLTVVVVAAAPRAGQILSAIRVETTFVLAAAGIAGLAAAVVAGFAALVARGPLDAG